jgi:hypothetical protein
VLGWRGSGWRGKESPALRNSQRPGKLKAGPAVPCREYRNSWELRDFKDFKAPRLPRTYGQLIFWFSTRKKPYPNESPGLN